MPIVDFLRNRCKKYAQKDKNALYGVLRAYKQLVKRGMKVKLDKVKNIDVRTKNGKYWIGLDGKLFIQCYDEKDADKCMAGLAALIRDTEEA